MNDPVEYWWDPDDKSEGNKPIMSDRYHNFELFLYKVMKDRYYGRKPRIMRDRYK